MGTSTVAHVETSMVLNLSNQELIDLGLKHSIHTSERKSFRSCRLRWNWAYREYYYPKVTPQPLEFGVAYHAAMEKWYDPTIWAHPDHREIGSALAISVFNDTCRKQLERYKKLNGRPTPEVMKNYQERLDLGKKMIEYYTKKISPLLDTKFSPLGVEVPFEIELGFKCKCPKCLERYKEYVIKMDGVFAVVHERLWEESEGLPVTYGGRIDMVAVDDYGRIFIVDWKSTSRILDEGKQATFLELDDQISSYCVALWKLGKPVAGFIYHEQRKAVPEPPQELLRMNKGRRFSVSQNANTDYQTFKAHIFEHDRDALEQGFYSDYLDWLRNEGPRFYQRHQIHRTEAQMQNLFDDMVAEAKDILEDPRIYPQPGRFSCTSCLYRQPCIGRSMNEDYYYTLNSMFDRREKHYYEETEDGDKKRENR